VIGKFRYGSGGLTCTAPNIQGFTDRTIYTYKSCESRQGNSVNVWASGSVSLS